MYFFTPQVIAFAIHQNCNQNRIVYIKDLHEQYLILIFFGNSIIANFLLIK